MNSLYKCISRHGIANTQNLRPSTSVKNVPIDKLQNNNPTRGVVTTSTLSTNVSPRKNRFLSQTNSSNISLLNKRHFQTQRLRNAAIESELNLEPGTNSVIHQMCLGHKRQLLTGSNIVDPRTTSLRWFKNYQPLNIKIVKSKVRQSKISGRTIELGGE